MSTNRPGMGLVVIVIMVAVAKVRHRAFVAAAESVAIIVTQFARHRRMTKRLMVIRVRMAVPFYVMTGRFDAFLESLSPRITKIIGDRVPGTILCSCRCNGSCRWSDCVRPDW